MSSLSSYTITLGKSKDFQRCTVFVHLLCVCLLYRSSFFPLLVGPLTALIVLTMMLTFWQAVPEPNYTELSFQKTGWTLHKRNGDQISYQNLDIEFDGGLFMLLTLTNSKFRKRLVVFYDQITTAQYRMLQFTIKRNE